MRLGIIADRHSRRLMLRLSRPHSAPRARRRLLAEPLDEPFGVVPRDELADDPARLRESLEAMEIEALLFEGAHEVLDDAIALGLTHLRRREAR